MSDTSALDHLLRRDRILVVGGLISAVLLSWGYLLSGAGMDLSAMGEMPLPMGPNGPGHLLVLFVMWAVMMAAMMLPSAAPMILFYAAIARRRRDRGEVATGTGVFALGYLVIWSLFSVGAAVLQWRLDAVALLSPAMATTSFAIAGLMLMAAGLYQFTPWKRACSRRCRSPLEFVLSEWREGLRGALIMGVRHGLLCVGCCWALMLLLFVGGVMNLLWIGGIALLVLIERTVPAGGTIGRAAGALLIASGGAVLLSLGYTTAITYWSGPKCQSWPSAIRGMRTAELPPQPQPPVAPPQPQLQSAGWFQALQPMQLPSHPWRDVTRGALLGEVAQRGAWRDREPETRRPSSSLDVVRPSAIHYHWSRF